MLKNMDSSLKGGLALLGIGGLVIIMIVWGVYLRPGAAVPAPPTPTPVNLAASLNGRSLFTIVPEESEARFMLTEVLRGQPTEVVGTTRELSGQIAVDLADLSTAELSPIRIDAAALETANPLRNRALHEYILLSAAYPEIIFTPKAVNGLPPQIAIGEAITFEIQGDLTITAFTQPVTFVVEGTAVSPTRLNGTATTTIQRADFQLVIPAVSGVADVAEAVELTLQFFAERN